jgi:hypothetical protein
MEVLFGDKSNFAIQAMLEPELKPPSFVWGRMCLWVSGIQLGDYKNSHCGLAQCTTHLNQVVEKVDQLDVSVFGDKNDEEIYSLLENAWLDPGSDDFGIENEFQKFHKYNFNYGFAEMFDRAPISFLLKQHNGSLRLLFKTSNSSKVKQHIFTKQLFIETVENFDAWFNDQSKGT